MKTLVITAGALAVALLGVLNLWERIFPPDLEDSARIESIERLKMTALSNFASEAIGTDIHLPTADAAGTSYDGALLVAHLTDDSGSTPTPNTDPVPSPDPTPTSTPTPTPTPTETPTTGVTPTPSGTPALRIRPPEEYIREVAEQAVFSGYNPELPRTFLNISVPDTVDQQGNPITPKEAAAELVDALADIELENSPSGLDALGWTIAVGLDLKGLADKPLLLTWSLDGVGVDDSWKAQNLAYRIIATTDHDTGTVKIWVPDLKGPSPYNVNVELVHESDSATADTATPLEIP